MFQDLVVSEATVEETAMIGMLYDEDLQIGSRTRPCERGAVYVARTPVGTVVGVGSNVTAVAASDCEPRLRKFVVHADPLSRLPIEEALRHYATRMAAHRGLEELGATA
jgi:hypothetical protein